MKRLLLVALVVLQQFGFVGLLGENSCMELKAQEITVVDCKILPNDNSAETNAERDINGNLCGLVKIVAEGVTNLQFPNKNERMGEVVYKAAENTYYVHVPEMLSKISFTHESYLPGEINLKDFGYKVKSGKTYLVTLAASSATSRNGRTITFRLNPATKGELFYEDKSVQIPADSIVEINHDENQFSYVIKADNFQQFRGNISAGTAPVARNITLQPITTAVNVTCNKSSAHIFVDNVDYGKVGTVNIPLGKHNIRVENRGYIDDSRDEVITANTKNLSFEIRQNKRKQIDIHATPVKIYAESKHIYKNNKRLEDWKESGDVVYMMPNKRYLLTTKSNKRNFIDVGTLPMTITFKKGKIVSTSEK